MGKKRAKAAKASGRTKLPKHVAGIKVPKALRKRSEALVDEVRTSLAPELLTSGLAVAARMLTRNGGEPGRPHAESPPTDVPGRPAVDYEEVGKVVGTVMVAAASALMASLAKAAANAGAPQHPVRNPASDDRPPQLTEAPPVSA